MCKTLLRKRCYISHKQNFRNLILFHMTKQKLILKFRDLYILAFKYTYEQY